jgi:hypothetical protein
MRHHQLPYEAAEGDELERLRPALVAVQEALGNFAFAGSVRDGASRDAFFKARERSRALSRRPPPMQSHASEHGSRRILS